MAAIVYATNVPVAYGGLLSMVDPAVNAAILEIVIADEERKEWAEYLAWCEMVPDLAKVPDDRRSYERWWKAVDRKAKEIFGRLN